MFGSRNGTGNVGTKKSKSTNVQKRRQALKWACESLETRRLFSTVSWITQGSGLWTDGTNWSTGSAPQPGDDVVINIPGINVVVTYNDPATLQLNNLLNNEVLILSGSGGATWTSGTFDGSGKVENLTNFNISGSADKILKDGETFENMGTTTVTGTGNIVGQVGATINNDNQATFDVQSDMEITFPTGIGDGNFNNEPGATFLKSQGGTAAGDMTEIGGAQGFTFNNDGDTQILAGTLGLGDNVNTSVSHGTFEIAAGATLEYLRGTENILYTATGSSPPYIYPSITGDGTLLMTGGTVQHYGIFDVDTVDMESGSFLLQQNRVATAATSQLGVSLTSNACPAGNINNLILNGGTFGGNGGGTFSFSGTTFNVQPTMNSSGGPFVTSSGMPQFSLPGGTYELPAAIISDTFSWTGGTISGSGRMVLDNTITSDTITTTNPKAMAGGFGLDLLLPLIWTGSGTINMSGGSSIWIHPSAEFWDQANGTFTGAGSTGNIVNSGNFLKEDGTGTTLLDTGINFVNDTLGGGIAGLPQILYHNPPTSQVAQLDIQTGTLALGGTSENTDDYTINTGATLSFPGGTHTNGTNDDLNNTAKILGVVVNGVVTGTIDFGDGATFTGDTEARLDVGTTNFGAGTYDFNNLAGGAQVIHAGSFTGGANGTIGGNGTLEIASNFQWNSGSFNGTNSGTSSLLIDSGAVVTMTSGSFDTTNNYSVDNNGTLQWGTSPGTLTIDGNFTQTTTGVFDSAFVGGVPDALSISGTVTIAGTLNLSVDSTVVTGGELFTVINNTGTLPISGTFTGYPEGAVFNVGADQFSITYVGGTGNNDLVLKAIVTPVITIATPAVLVRPLAGLTDLIFTVSLSAPTNNDVTVTYATTAGSAIAGTDYLTTDGSLTIAAGDTSGIISVPVTGTALVESTRTFTVTLSNPTFSTLGTPHIAVGSIVARNGPPVLSFSTTSYTVDENGILATILVKTSDPAISSTVQYSTANGTAIAGVDYTAVSGTLTFNPGVSSQTFTVPITDEGLLTGQKTFNVNLSNAAGSGATVGTGTATVTIIDDDGAKPVISIGNATVTEYVFGQVDEVFTLTLSQASKVPVSVQYATADGTAVAGKYVPQSGTITLQPNQLTAQISIPINSDFVQNSTETYSVNLSNPVETSLGVASGIGTILSQTLTTVQISAGHPFRYIDAFGARASISLSGVGSGTVSYLGSVSDDGKQVVLTNTTASSVLTIATSRGQTAVVNIIDDGSLGAINAPTTRLQGDVDVAGALRSLRLYSLVGDNSINVGTGAKISSLTASFGTVNDTTLTSAIPIASLHFTSWQDVNTGAGIIAPSAKAIHSVKNFQANLTLTGNLTSLVVGGAMTNSVVRVGGNITTLTAGTISGSDIFAGVLSEVGTLPTLTSQFADTSSSILHLSVTRKTAGAFANTLIAAPIVGTVALSTVAVNNGGNPFGVAGTTIRSVTGRGTTTIKQTQIKLVTSPFSDNDLYIHLTTSS